MRKTLPHKGIVLRSHACLEETQRNKQECFVWGGNRMNDHWGDFSVLPPPSHSLSPSPASPTLPQPFCGVFKQGNFQISLSQVHWSAESQHLRTLNALPSRTVSTLSWVERRCKSRFAAHQLWDYRKITLPPGALLSLSVKERQRPCRSSQITHTRHLPQHMW